MAIAAIQSPLGTSIQTAWSMGKGATVRTSSQMFASMLGALVPSGQYPVGTALVPLTPSGMSAMSSLMTSGLSLGKGAKVNTTSKLMAQSIAVLAPLCPPAGQTTLGSLIQTSMSMDRGAKVDTVAKQVAQAVTLYYQIGGTL